MDWSVQIKLTAATGALLLGAGALWREPLRPRNRHFALVCLAISIWTFGDAARGIAEDGRAAWRLVSLAGSCAAAPLALHLAFVLARARSTLRRLALPAAYAVAGLLWASAWTPFLAPNGWNILALVVLGSILASALGVLTWARMALPRGPERSALGLLLVAGFVAVGGGLSDLVPRGGGSVPAVGPAATLVFLVIVCGLIVRHRFMDVDVFLIRTVILVAGAASGGLLIFAVAKWTDGRFLPIAVATLVVLLFAAALGRTVMSGAPNLVGSRDPVVRALQEVSRVLATATDIDAVWAVIRRGRDMLPGDARVDVTLRAEHGTDYVVRYRSGEGPPPPGVPATAALPVVLGSDPLPLTRSYLDRELQDTRRADTRRHLTEALEHMDRTDTDLVVPLTRGDDVLGWIAVGGGFPERRLTAEIATAFLAVGNQAVASLERIEAIERAKQKEALAAVGELAGGLAHEIRNPAAAIRGAAQSLGPEATPEQRRAMLEVIDEESERLGRFVGEFLDYARPASPRREPVPLDGVVRQVLRASAAGGRPLDATVEVDGVVRALGDPEQIRRAFENLARNAWEAAGPGAKLLVQLRHRRDGRVEARFEDNGPGIPEDRIPHLFRPFYTTKPDGTGLGLAIVHGIVESHGGEIRIEGNTGSGAAISLVLPAAHE